MNQVSCAMPADLAAALELNILKACFFGRMVKKIHEALGGSEAGKKIAALGLTFKQVTDDIRDSPSLAIIPNLIDKGATIRAHDPQDLEEAKKLLPEKVVYFNDIYEAITGADAVVLMTEWNEYRGLDFERLRQQMKGTVFVDLRNVYEPIAMRNNDVTYACIG